MGRAAEYVVGESETYSNGIEGRQGDCRGRLGRRGDAGQRRDPWTVAEGTWTRAAAMSEARWGHTATPLADGRILVVGGVGIEDRSLASAEIYDPATDRWAVTGAMSEARDGHTATPLADGRILAIGGVGANGEALASVEIYDSTTGQWSLMESMDRPRAKHTATLLRDGRVMVVGGNYGRDYAAGVGGDVRPRDQSLDVGRLDRGGEMGTFDDSAVGRAGAGGWGVWVRDAEVG